MIIETTVLSAVKSVLQFFINLAGSITKSDMYDSIPWYLCDCYAINFQLNAFIKLFVADLLPAYSYCL
jgi:hypothetical protein